MNECGGGRHKITQFHRSTPWTRVQPNLMNVALWIVVNGGVQEAEGNNNVMEL